MAEKQFPSERKGLYFVGFALLCCLALFVNPILTPRSPVPRDHIDLSDVAVFSLEKISFCLLVVLLSAVGVWGLWKLVQRDVSAWAALDFQQSLALVLLAGLLSTIVLKVVSGAREFAMSEAWKNRGIGEPLERSSGQLPTLTEQIRNERERNLRELRMLFWSYAAAHEGAFPEDIQRVVPTDLWKAAGFVR